MSAYLRKASLMAALTAAALAVGITVAPAADLYGQGYYPPPERYAERDYSGYEGEGSYPRDHAAPYGEDELPPPPIRFTDRRAGHDAYPAYEESCVPRWKVRQQLRRDGWVDLQPLDRGGGLVTVRARREQSGRVFLLKLDRCSGEVIEARRHFLRSFGDGPYAYGRRNYPTY